MKRWLLMGLSAAYAGMSAQAALAANPAGLAHDAHAVLSGPAPSMAAAQPLSQPANFDASFAAPKASLYRSGERSRLETPEVMSGAMQYHRLQPAALAGNSYDKTLNKPTFIWAGNQAGAELDFAAYREGAGAPTYAKAYLRNFASRLSIKADALDQARLVFVHDDGAGPVIVRYQQVVDGLEVVGRQLNVVMDQDLNLVAISGYFATGNAVPAKADLGAFRAGPQAAMNAAFSDLGVPVSAYSLHRTPDNRGGFAQFAPQAGAQSSASVRLTAPVGAKEVLFPVNGQLVPGWLMTVQAGRAGSVDSLGYAYVASADGSRVLYRKNLVNRATYTYRVFADAATQKPDDSPFGNGLMPYPGPVTETFGAGTLVDVNATQGVADPWLPIPVAGFPTYQTIGNNVWAYLDVAGEDGRDNPADAPATTTAANTFDYAFDFAVSPTTASNQAGATVNLFYIDNWLHDAWYNAGFTEEVGNAQYVNYGRGGVGGDPILAEAQDNSGRNNANMFTPPDGSSPRQQMYLWNGPVLSRTVALTTSGTGTFEFDPALAALFGPIEYDVTGDLVIYNDGIGDGSAVSDACEPTSQDLTGKIALIADIFTCRFDAKVKNAEDAGAIAAVIVYNDDPTTDNAFLMGGDNIVTIPSLGISDQDANPVIDAINAGDTVTLHMMIDRAPDRDGSVDTQIVTHEFFHYVSNRLVGDALGLSNQQGGGMGEGWSDMASLLLTARADDLANNPDGYYTTGGYAADDFLYGVRSYPYVTGSPMHFADIMSNPEVHFVGTVWSTMLWEAYVGLYKHYAAEDPTTAYVTTKTKMMNYLIESLMATPNAPTMVEARDALLAVAKATDEADYDIFVSAFAAHGMGFGAIAPPRGSTSLTGVVESYATDLKAFAVQDAQINVNGEFVCDADNSLDPGEYGEITITVRNTGSADLDGITAQLSSEADITFANGGKVTFDKVGMFGGTVTATTTARVNSATTQSEVMAIAIAFPEMGDTDDAVQEPDAIQLQFTSNQDFKATKSSDDVENPATSIFDWTRTMTGNGSGWFVATSSGLNSDLGLPADNLFWYGPDNGSPSDIALVTPQITVGDEAFSVSFIHYYEFEAGGFDGGVVEISTDGGETWKDVTEAGGTFEFGYNGTIGPFNDALNGRAGFVNTGGYLADNAPETISFGTALAGKTVQLRFRVGSDPAASAFGWVIDNVTVEGAAAPMFSTVVAEDGLCGGHPPVANAGPDMKATGGDTMTLDGSGSSDAEGAITYQWKQTDGKPVQLSNATSAKASFTAPNNSGKLIFELTVMDEGGLTASDSVTVDLTRKQANPAPTGNGGGGSTGLLMLFGLLGLSLVRRRRD